MSRAAGPAALLAAVAAGLAWSPTFAVAALAPLVALVLVPALVVDQLSVGRPRWALARPLLGLLGGVVVLVALLVPAGDASLAEIAGWLAHGWQRTLESTLPARPDRDLVAFVPALVLAAGVLGVEWTRHAAAPVLVLLPSFAVLVLSQSVRAAQGLTAAAIAAGYGVAVASVLAAGRASPARRVIVSRWRWAAGSVALVVPLLLVAGAATWGGSVLVSGRVAYSVQDGRAVATRGSAVADPLSQIGDRLVAGDGVAFTVRTSAPVDRWPLAVLDTFDGADWSSGGQVRILGAELPGPPAAVPVATADAEITDIALPGPWLPSQPRLRAVEGVRALVEPATGVLLRPDGAPLPDSYRLRWEALRIDREQLATATIDPAPTGAVELAEIPAGIAELARTAVGPGVGPSVQSALLLEKWMREGYTVADGADVPTGHGYPHLLHFLTTSKRGTSEQFATAYAVLARSIGIPTRVVVGFRDDGSGTVHNRDVLAWPEIAVSGLGWVPLDPTGGARTGGGAAGGLSAATEAARQDLPGPGQPAQQAVAAPVPVPAPALDRYGPTWWAAPVALIALLAAVPVAKLLRRGRRRRGPPRAAVLGAWREVRDTLLDQGIAVPAGATVRELAPGAPVDPADLAELAGCVDTALWSGAAVGDGVVASAWSAAGRVRRAVRRRSLRSRLRAGWSTASLRRRQLPQLAPRSD